MAADEDEKTAEISQSSARIGYSSSLYAVISAATVVSLHARPS